MVNQQNKSDYKVLYAINATIMAINKINGKIIRYLRTNFTEFYTKDVVFLSIFL